VSSLPNCSVEGCVKSVSKAGFKLCLEHWRLENKELPEKKEDGKINSIVTLNSTQLGERLGVDAKKLNQVLSELGWIEKGKKGWVPTLQGKKLQAQSLEYFKTGVPFVTWPESIVTSNVLKNAIAELIGSKADNLTEHAVQHDKKEKSFRDKFQPTHRAIDGHWVRSRAETLIDNWLYMSRVMHAYERLLPIEEELYCDFYIPAGKVYIEYWGLEKDPKYQDRKIKKLEIYKKYALNLIELTDEHILNLDDHLPKMLLKFDVVVD
jgi:hypothetical protein